MAATHPASAPHDIEPSLHDRSSVVPPTVQPIATANQFIRVEANLLRFPIFSLSTKGLKNVDQIQCVGVKREGTREHRFALTVSRNTRFVYPGPLARKIHFALLSILYEQAHPFQNPVAFTWRDLARRIQIAVGGNKVARMKEAIRSIHGVIISTEYALKRGVDRQPLPAQEHGYHLYSQYAFVNDQLPDGRMADRNYVWFADWYLANLNAFYAAPINYPLWVTLNEQSPIASRLYEFLLFNFTGGHPVLTINYANLAQFLPIRVERFLSKAREKLDPALKLLVAHRVIRAFEWTEAKTGAMQLRFLPELTATTTPSTGRIREGEETEFLESIEVREVRSAENPSQSIVRRFNELWMPGQPLRPAAAEIALADELLDQYGRKTVEAMLPVVVKRMKQEFPAAKTFGATRRYFISAHAERERRQRADERQSREVAEQVAYQDRDVRREQQEAELDRRWQELSVAEQTAIRQTVLVKQPRSLQKFPKVIHRFCLQELARRTGMSAAA